VDAGRTDRCARPARASGRTPAGRRRCDDRARRAAGVVHARDGHRRDDAAISAFTIVSIVIGRLSTTEDTESASSASSVVYRLTMRKPIRIGIGGPVGSGKTALVDCLCKRMRAEYRLGVITNDIFTREDMEFLVRSEALSADRIIGVQTGGCPHTAIREDASMNFDALDELTGRFPDLDVVFLESGGDNLAASFSPELVDASIYVIDVSGCDKIPRKGGPCVTRSDLHVINKVDLAPHVGADLDVMKRDAKLMRGQRSLVFTNLKTGAGLEDVVAWIRHDLLYEP